MQGPVSEPKAARSARAKAAGFGMRHEVPHVKIARMDIERINLIGTLLADLKDRTEQLRGYL